MKNFISLFCIFLLCALVISPDAQARIFNKFAQPTAIAVDDTTSISISAVTMLNIAGRGMLYNLTFNNASATKDATVLVTIDGVIDSVTVAAGEEQTCYVVRSFVPSGAGTDDDFIDVISDSTLMIGHQLNLPFNTQLLIQAHDEDQAGIAQVHILYGKE